MTLIGDFPTGTPDGDDSFLGYVDGAVRRVTGSATKAFVLPSRIVDPADFTPLTTQLLESADTLTGWTLQGPSSGQVIRQQTVYSLLIPVGHTQGADAVGGSLNLHSGVAASLYFTFSSPQAIGARSQVAMDVTFKSDGPVSEATLRTALSCVVADDTVLTGNTNVITFPTVPQQTWTTVVLPLDGLTAIKSIGIQKTFDPGAGGWTDPAVNYRGWVLIDNIRFLDDTKIDAALGSGTTAGVLVPADYANDANQLPLVIGENKGVLDIAKGVFSGLNKVINLHEHFAYIAGAETGETDVATAIDRIINNAEPGQIVRGTPGATYRFDHGFRMTPTDVEVDFTGCTLMLNYQTNTDFCAIAATRFKVRGGLWLGKGLATINGSAAVTVTGTPTTSGTTKLLDAQNEEVKAPTHVNYGGRAGFFARHLPQQLGLAYDGLAPRWYVDFVLSDSAQVTDDCVISIVNDDSLAVLATSTLTLTGTPTTYRLSAFPTDRLTRLRFTVKKATATANTITLTSFTTYGENEYNETYDTAACFDLTGCRDVALLDMHVEGFGGDAIQVSNANVHGLHVDGVVSWGCRRQGMSFNQGTDMVIENCEVYATGRSAIDFEPYGTDWYTQNVTVRNIYMDQITNYGFAMANWARNFDYMISDVILGQTRFGMIYGGFVRGTISNCVTRWDSASDWDWDIFGIDMTVSDCISIAGIRLEDETNTFDDGTGIATFTPTNNVIRNFLITPTTTNARLIFVDGTGSGYRLENITISTKPEAEFVWSSTPAGGMYSAGQYSGINFGELSRQFPNTYKGIAYSDIWVVNGLNGHDDPIHQVRGISGSSTRSNNLRGVGVEVAPSAISHTVTFPTRNVGTLGTNAGLTSSATAGSLLASTTYYYRFAARELYAGPGPYRAQQSVATSVGHTAISVNLRGTLDTANGKYSNGMTILRGTTNGGPYTTRFDVLPNATAPLAGLAAAGVDCVDLGTSLTVAMTGFATSFPAQSGSWTGSVNESGWEPNASYAVMVETNWPTLVSISNKTTAGFTINFNSPAPGDGSGLVSWLLIR